MINSTATSNLARFNPLNLFRSNASRREQFYQRMATTPLHLTPPTRQSSGGLLSARRPTTRLSSRRAQAAFAAPLGIAGDSGDGRRDGARVLHILQQGKPKAILEAARQTSTNPALVAAGETYQGNFFSSFHKEIGNLSNGELQRLHGRLNSRKMTALRGGLARTAKKGLTSPRQSRGVRVELAATRMHLENINRQVVAEMSNRDFKLGDGMFEKVPALPSWSGAKATQKTLLQFATYIEPRVASKGGDVPPHMRREIEADFTQLCAESETREAQGKEGGVALLDPDDPNAPELNVSEIYLKDFGRGERVFTSSEGTHTNKETGFHDKDRAEISDHLTEFCKGSQREQKGRSVSERAELSANQARRVQALLTQQTMAPLYEQQALGKLLLPPMTGLAEQEVQNPQMIGNSNYNFNIQRMSNGDVDVHIMQYLQPQMLHYNDENKTGFEKQLDNKRSFIETRLRVIISRKKSAPPFLREFTYDAHLVAKNS